jgi:purine-binding chemotaxis protein CheW
MLVDTMDQSKQSRAAILKARALALAKPLAIGPREALTERLVIVRVGETEVGIATHTLQAVIRHFLVTPLFGAPPWLAGITHVRGQLVSVVRLAHWLDTRKPADGPQLAVLSGTEGPVGVLINEVVDFRDIRADELATAIDSGGSSGPEFIRITKDLLTVLDVPAFLSSQEIVLNHG